VSTLTSPFNAPGEDHNCMGCHDDYTGYGSRPPTSCTTIDSCHGPVSTHSVAVGSHRSPEYPTTSAMSITTPVSAGTITPVRASASSRYVKIAKAQYRIMNNAGTGLVRDWQNMDASDGTFDSRGESIIGNIDTTGLLGTYTINVRAMDNGHVSQSGGVPHNPAIPYYPDNGVWTRLKTTTPTEGIIKLTVTTGGPTPTPAPTPHQFLLTYQLQETGTEII